MSAPDSPSSKARPSLLSDTAKSAANNDSRILANLEGRVSAQSGKPHRSKKPWIVVLVAAVGLSAFGAWHWQRTAGGNDDKLAAVPAALTDAQKAVATAPVDTKKLAAAAGTDALKTAASAPQPAVIVADATTPEQGRLSAPANAIASSGASISSTSTTTTTASGADSTRLSRALTDGTQVASGASAPVPQAKGAVTAHAPVKTAAAHSVHEADKKRHAERVEHVAAAHPRRDAKSSAKSKEDQDVDLLAALVARTKPYDAKQLKTSNNTSAAPLAQQTRSATAQAASVHNQGLADQVAECSNRGLIDGQFCRWHVCADHWGKDPACPTSTSAGPH
ncbi:hypothetical protein LJR230_000764 [Trinickia sp. LjRoot230]|uniref:hypothetical protein n=1 Tax=Trinickia sp. LjRoot230 TaxID=3342288 RepID=UPI003ECCE0BD